MSRDQKLPYVRFFASDWLAGTRGMKAVDTGIYITLIALMYERCEPLVEDHRRLARQCGCGQSVFTRVLEGLIGDGKVLKTDRGLWNSRVEIEFIWREKLSKNNSDAANSRWAKEGKENKNNDTDMQSQSERNANGMPSRSQKSEARSKIEQTSFSLRSNDTREIDTSFEAFWSAYPNKVGKPAAKTAYKKAIKKAKAEEILAGVERYAANKPADRAWCNPTTFLNQERWGDQPGEVSDAPVRKAQNGVRKNGIGYYLAPGCEQFVAHRDYCKKIHDMDKYWEFVSAETSGAEVHVADLWPQRR